MYGQQRSKDVHGYDAWDLTASGRCGGISPIFLRIEKNCMSLVWHDGFLSI